MQIELSQPLEHDADHAVEVCIEGLPLHAIFCSHRFIAFKLTEAQVRQMHEELGEWLRSR